MRKCTAALLVADSAADSEPPRGNLNLAGQPTRLLKGAHDPDTGLCARDKLQVELQVQVELKPASDSELGCVTVGRPNW